MNFMAIDPGNTQSAFVCVSNGRIDRFGKMTCVWIGRFTQSAIMAGADVHLVYRKDIKLHLCHSVLAKDSNIRQALIDRWGAPGTKKAPGPTYGITNDVWAALAVAIYGWTPTNGRRRDGIRRESKSVLRGNVQWERGIHNGCARPSFPGARDGAQRASARDQHERSAENGAEGSGVETPALGKGDGEMKRKIEVREIECCAECHNCIHEQPSIVRCDLTGEKNAWVVACSVIDDKCPLPDAPEVSK